MCSRLFRILTCTLTVLSAVGCYQGPPPLDNVSEIKGDFAFSGHQWRYKNATTPVGPGPNRFTNDSNFAWVDNSGQLHLKINKKNNLWTCSEIVSTKVFGYGTYIVTCNSDVSIFDKNVVFGFFTWDSYSFQTQGNSEIDVEFSRWGNANDTNLVTFSAQPVIFNNPVAYAERTYKAAVPTTALKQAITYMFRWTPDSVRWECYAGLNYPGANKLASWTFTKNNVPRQKLEGSQASNPIVIPAPSDSTNVRFNFWLLNGQGPSNSMSHEVVVSNFKYTPL
jgi:hypothetical protein